MDSQGIIQRSTFGQRPPPLSIHIRRILERYPDGQIFKELIQNADDAGARVVHFYIDSRQHPTNSLADLKLAAFQGPALIAANDAVFTEKDWEGIQNLENSIKSEDPFKIGKFGIGFNSVYHITDLPTIISGEKIAYLEPQEKIWHGQTGGEFKLEQHRNTDTLKPFHGIEGFDFKSVTKYKKTLFRFPLRDTKSSLSENIFTVERLQALTEPLEREAEFLLLFLRSVVNVAVYEIPENGTANCLFAVNIAQQCQSSLFEKRKYFQQQMEKMHSVTPFRIATCITSVVNFSIEITDKNKVQTSTSWLAANQAGSDNEEILDAAANQRVFPVVGVALQLNRQAIMGSPDAHSQLFCFLPMPAEVTSPLQVHVHGTFGLSDNRRAIKWPTGEMKNDLAARWNHMIVSDLLPSCYNLLLREAKKHITPEHFYRTFPCVESTSKDLNWSLVLKPLFGLLFQCECFWADKFEEWVDIEHAIMVPDNDLVQPTEVVLRVLTKCGVKLVNLPSNIFQALNKYCDSKLRVVSPTLCRLAIRECLSSYVDESDSDKLELLQYCLHDLDDRYDDLCGLALLPLADDSFIEFTMSNDEIAKIRYICTEQFPKELLPSLERRLVDVDVIRPELQKQLLEVAESQKTQLQMLTVESVAQLLSKCYPDEWKDKEIVKLSVNEPDFSTEWFALLWKCINNYGLSLFESMLIVPLTSPGGQEITHLTRLKKVSSSSVLLVSDSSYSEHFLTTLTRLGVHCTALIDMLKHDQLNDFINCFDTFGVLNAISNSTEETSHLDLTMTEAIEFQTFFVSHLHDIRALENQPILLETLKNLCIYQVLNNKEVPVSLQKATQISWKNQVILEPSSFQFSSESLPSNLIVLSQRNEKTIIGLLKNTIATPSKTENFIFDFLIPFIRSGPSNDSDKIDELMEEVFRLFPVLKKNDIVGFSKLTNELSTLPFLLTEEASRVRKSPLCLYDPSRNELKSVLHGKSVFPINQFATDPNLLEGLRECKIQTIISARTIFSVLNEHAAAYNSDPIKVSQEVVSRVKAVMTYLDKNQDIFAENLFLNTALKGLSHKNWLPILAKPPNHYPTCLVWKGRRCPCHVASPDAINNTLLCDDNEIESLPFIVGSQMFVSCCPPSVRELFLTDKYNIIVIERVFSHFQHVTENVRSFETSRLDSLVHKFYSYLSSHLQQLRGVFQSSELCMRRLIWIKKCHKFVTPNTMFVNENQSFEQSLHLAPYFEHIPENLQNEDYNIKLFECFGVHPELTDSDIVSVLNNIKEDKCQRVPIKQAWKMVENILNWLTETGTISVTAKFNLAEVSDPLLVPVEGSEEEWPCLMPVQEVVYTDLDYLRSFKEEHTVFIHDKFSSLAPYLGVKSLSKHLDISDDAFGDVGQHEPLVTRLRNILKDYQGGLTIIKELLQNADDAGATELTICYDARVHEAKAKSLIFPGMADCHGPALLVHNNATFTDEDFENITKLAGATKMNKPLKIGKFGVGFCSVYHITDIPSFISGKWLYIFDPTISYLKKEITDPTKPGKRISFTEKAVGYSSQLLPYENLFGFNQKTEYNETLFRFPFRFSQSEISTVVYSETQVKELADEIQKAGSKLLLFLSNVKRITFSRIDDSMSEPSTICVVEKTSISQLITNQPTQGSGDSSVNLVQINISSCEQQNQSKSKELWIVSSNSKVVHDPNKPCDSSVACLINCSCTKSYSVKCLSSGEMFCYLPLLVQTGLPVHVSANFAVLNDRTGIHKSDSDNPTEEVQWNIQLMKTVIPEAYFLLLSAIKQLCISGKITIEQDYKFYSLWPLFEQLKFHNPFDDLLHSLYKLLADSELFYSPCQSKWMYLSSTLILSPGILLMPNSHEAPPRCVVEVCETLQYPLIYLPSVYLTLLPKQIIEDRTIDELHFLDSFFTNIAQVPEDVRNTVLLLIFKAFALESKDYIKIHLESKKCVPCTPDGKCLKKCQNIIDPCASFSSLYDEDDKMFPLNEFHRDSIVHTALQTLGMINIRLPWPMILERAKCILPLYKRNPPKALKRSETLISCITQHNTSNTMVPSELDDVPFLPVMKKPNNSEYPECFLWFGQDQTLLPGNKLIKSGSNVQLAGSQVCFLNEFDPENGGCGQVNSTTAESLGIKPQPSSVQVVRHLCHIENVYTAEEHKQTVQPWIESACELIYKHIERLLRDTCHVHDISVLKSTRSIWTGNEFVVPTSVTKCWNHDGPILFAIPQLLKSKKNLIRALEIQEKFTTIQLHDCLRQLHDDYKGKCIEGTAFITAVSVCKLLGEEKQVSESVCYLPDENKCMSKASNLVYNDAPWCVLDEECATVHEDIPRRVALNLGVMPIRSKALQQYENLNQDWGGVEFGQHEKLTQRIRNILSQYPGDVTILKELLQNADDAKAKKMYIILDKRQHGTNKLPSDDWKDLQGPALLVWNDRGFSNEDFRGIQRLGLGSKRSDTESIGQFGIGFNAVYHLTDCPSFLTNGNTLCVLDPHCRYIPGASILNPGRRYDGIDEKFWDRLCDLKSTYLLDQEDLIDSCEGTLFRFPLRHTGELVEKSELVDRSGEESDSTSLFGSSSTPLDPNRMERYVMEWAPKMKEALLFLNSVSELKFFVIDSTSMTLTHSYSVQSNEVSLKRKKLFLESVKTFTDGYQPCVVQYPICLNEDKPLQVNEKWLIHQGIGDIKNPNEIWHYPQVKPKHGIAVKLTGSDFVGKVFCFLPLPIQSRLPVHVNGNFILDAARSGLWKSRDTNADDKQKWNKKLIKAIASSYATFLVTCQSEYFTSGMAKEMIEKYYSVFPVWLHTKHKTPEGEMKMLAEQVYHELHKSNFCVLVAMFMSVTPSNTSLQWLPLHNNSEPYKQVHFWINGHKSQRLPKILARIGVHLTEAPLFIMEHFEDAGITLPIADPKTVYEYYCMYYKQVSKTFPNFISDTKFESVQDFLEFIRYLLRPMLAAHESGLLSSHSKEFPELPYDVPLLLTADEKLSMFSHSDKVICSNYSHIFSVNVKKHFAHPEVNDLKLNPDYFVKDTDDNWQLICTILVATVPSELQKERLVNVGEHVSIENFVAPMWKCLSCDPVFKKHFRAIVEKWALLLSTKQELFMYKSNKLLPIIEPRKERKFPEESLLSFHHQKISLQNEDLKLYNQVFQIIEKHDLMPILDLAVVDLSLCLGLCPRMNQPKRILDNLCCLHETNGLEPLLFDIDLDEIIEVLFNYFSYINFAQCHEQYYLDRIKSLPLFKDVSGTYRSLKGKLYIWPNHVCLSGKYTWMSHIPDYVVFMAHNGAWTTLGSASVLGIESMSPLVFYVEFIFPLFHSLSDQERQEHLKHIRDTPQLFDDAQYYSQAGNDDKKKKESVLFLSKLRQLPCLKKKGSLTCISDFCDPTIIIFGMFAETAEFPPEPLSDKKWLEFFRNIGLRTKASPKEFLSFCESVANGRQQHIVEASRVLLEYLFNEGYWYSDEVFLDKVSKIPFACAEDLKDLTCIVSVANVENVVQQGNKAYRLTSLRKAATKPVRNLIWTTKPIVELPSVPSHYAYKNVQAFLRELQVCIKPSYEDVISNIINISKSRFAQFELFDVYPVTLTQQKGKEHLLCKVLRECFAHLKKSNHQVVLESLKDIPCIPVSRNGDTVDNSSPVLVQPLQVIASKSKDVVKLVPFLNPLPTDMYPVLDILSKIGVKCDIELDNVQHALKTVHNNIEPPITNDPNTSEVVKQLIKCMYSCLQDKQELTGVLFLPNEAGMLVESKQLVFNDVERFKGANLNLSSSSYSFLSLLSEKLKELKEYGFRSREFYSTLPESVRPLPLSACYKEKLSDQCKSESELSQFASTIKRAFEFPDFVKVVKLLMTAFSSQTEPPERFLKDLELFHSSVNVLVVTDLQVDVYLTCVSPPLYTGRVKVDFLLQEEASSLFIDKGVYALKLNLFESLTSAIVSHIVGMGCSVEEIAIHAAEKAIGILLKAPTPNQIEELLNDQGINTADIEITGATTFKFTPKLGSPIPEEWHHRLYCDMCNVFKPQEWVGYEDRENHFIFARVEHSTMAPDSDEQGVENQQTNSDETLSQYKITISEDEQGIEGDVTVTVLDLYKILRVKLRKFEDDSTEMILYDPDSESVQLWNAVKDDKLRSILKEICQQLKRIWRLKDKEQRRKAIKAMYLKWHPDKNPSPLATKAFQFLQRQIQRLEQGLPLEEPDETNEESQPSFTPNSYWGTFFRNWDNIARSRSRYWRQERTYSYCRSWTWSRASHGASLFDNLMEDVRVTPDPYTAQAWIKQAEHDLKALEILARETDTHSDVSAHTCFMAHQVAEKALKAGMYQVNGLHSSALKNHQLMRHANAIVQMRSKYTAGLPTYASKLESYYLNSRYPNRYTPVKVPSDQYTLSQATEAKDAAEKIIAIIKTLM